MIEKKNLSYSKILAIILLIVFSLNLLIVNPSFKSESKYFGKLTDNINQTTYPLPYKGLEFSYDLSLAVYIDETPIQIPIDFFIFIDDSTSVPLNYQQQGYNFSLRIETRLALGIIPLRENATFYVNQTSRTMILDEAKTEGNQIGDFLVLIYNGDPGVVNFNPFWIFPEGLSLNQLYSIFSFDFNLTRSLTWNFENNIGLKSTWIAKLEGDFYNSLQNVNSSYDLSVLYDKHTGILIQGFLKGRFDFNNGTIKNYSMNFLLNSTNAFNKFPPDPLLNSTSTNTNGFPIISGLEPNFLLLIFFFSLPIFVTLINFVRIRKIDGGV